MTARELMLALVGILAVPTTLVVAEYLYPHERVDEACIDKFYAPALKESGDCPLGAAIEFVPGANTTLILCRCSRDASDGGP